MPFSIRILNRQHTGFLTPFSELETPSFESPSVLLLSQIKGIVRSHNVILSHKAFVDCCLALPIDDLPYTWQELQISGQFSAIVDLGSHWLLCTDPIRSYPLYYWFSDSTLFVTDTLLPTDRKPNLALAPEFLWFGFVSGSDTLYKGAKQVLAGQCVLIHKITGQIQSFFYAPHKVAEMAPTTVAGALADLYEYDQALWDRFLEEIGDRPIWIPLNGELGSLHILSALIKRGYKQQIYSFSYGRLGLSDMEIAKQVADQCKIPWFPILFSDATWASFSDEESQNFIKHSFSGSAIPQWMEWVAFRQLITSIDVPLNAVIVPGHGGDFLGGSHLRSELGDEKSDYPSTELIPALCQHHGKLITPSLDERQVLYTHLSAQLPSRAFWDTFSFASVLESWNVLNRQSKFIGNACQAYSWFGYDWKMPLWDYSYAQFWHKLPRSMRSANSLYHRFLFETYFTPLGIGDIAPITVTKRGVLSQFKQYCPTPFYNTLKNWAKDIRRESVDFNGWQWLNDELQKHIDGPVSYREREDHALLAKWLVQKFIF